METVIATAGATPASSVKKSERDYRVADPAAPAIDTAADELDNDVETRACVVDERLHGERLDKALVSLAGEFSRSHLQGLIARGHVRVDDAVAGTASRKLKLGQRLSFDLVPTAESRAFRPEPVPLDVVFEDADLLVLNKPAGLVVHPAAGHWSGTLLNGLLAHHEGAASLPRAGIVHRLDKDTTGLMVVAKRLPAMTALVRAIAARDVHREYLALAHGEISRDELSVEAPIGRDPRSRVRMAVVGSGKPARTDVRCVARGQGVSAVRCTLHTGRTHQIRVHLAHLGHALIGDTLYGGRELLGMHRQALHATALRFAHPSSGEAMAFEAPAPADLASAWGRVLAA